jgi:FtsP/CotA-like multicopper oxidase with cupredoxin domain
MRADGKQRRRGAPGARRRTTASFLATLMVGGGLVGGLGSALSLSSPAQALTVPRSAAPTDPTDSTKVPHYFGPWPNWALSPLTTSTAKVTITDPGGQGSGATATANVDPATGGIASIHVTDPGSGYTAATVAVSGGTTDAVATATVSASGALTGFTVGAAGGGYSSFKVDLAVNPGNPGTGGTAQAYGKVDSVTIAVPGDNYTAPVVEFDLPDLPDGRQAKGHVDPAADLNGTGGIAVVHIDDAGSGYLKAPGIAIHNGTVYDPVAGATLAEATTTLALDSVVPQDFGSGYTAAPTVTITDPAGTGPGHGAGATATATTDVGAVTAITVDPAQPGSGYLSKGIKKFQDALPTTCDPASTAGCPATGKYIPIVVPDTTSYPGADTYEIGVVQYRTSFSSDLPATLARGYVQLDPKTGPTPTGSQHAPLVNELLDGSTADTGYRSVTPPRWLGPFILARKNRPVRVIFRNLLPTGKDGDLFLPADSSMMGSGSAPMADNSPMPAPVDQGTVTDEVRNPLCTQQPKPSMCFKDNRAELHLHGGLTPWISDGTPHQWITPANESTAWPQGVSVKNVPDMKDTNGNVACDSKTDGCQTFFYTNQQSARLMFYHDHSWGITRLNVYAGEAAGYAIGDATEDQLVSTGTIPGAADTVPLIVQDRTFVPKDSQLAAQDPTWDKARWGGEGSFWYHHVYMPAQNPGDPSGMSAYGRWMYGPWFWPPATGTKYGPIDNPYYDPNCNLDDPLTWQYQTDPFCEPKQIPGTPNISAGMEQFNDTPLVNGIAYPTVTLQPKSYRMRLLNAANDRFFNLQWYKADTDPANGGLGGTDGSEVKLKAAELAAAQNDPNVSPTPAAASNPGTNDSSDGPDWVQIGTEGGFLPAPAVIDGQQPTTWITDPTRFDFGNVDLHSLLVAPAERADAIVDFSKFAGQTLILYNDAPAAFPARISTYDYYTGAPDLSPNGAPKILPGYGPNTRTIMKVEIADVAPAPAFDLAKLQTAFKHTVNGTGAFESGQHPIIVGQAAYNSAYGTSFAAASNCSVGTKQTCDGLVRINDTAQLNFNTLRSPTTRVSMKLEPKAIHDEMNSSTFDEFGRMQANLGVEASPPTPGAQNVTLYPYVNPSTELIDGTNLPTSDKVTPIASMADGTQIWRITHNGVDTHPIHFHLFDVQLLNRVTWDNIIIKPDANELGWKDTVRISPLEDTIVALRPIVPKLPFEVPNAIRPLNPMEPIGSTAMFNNVDGNPTAAIANQLVNFGWEYVYHCHILSHEEMDMMRPVSLALPPLVPDGLSTALNAQGQVVLTWNDNSITETSFLVQRSTDNGTTWTDVGTSDSPLDQPNTHGTRTLVDPGADPQAANQYRVVARNTVGYGGAFPSKTVSSTSAVLSGGVVAAPADLAATVNAGPVVDLTWNDKATNETGFGVERSTDGGTTWTPIATPPANPVNGATAWTDATVTAGSTYSYRVGAVGPGGPQYSGTVTVQLVATPTTLVAVPLAGPAVGLAWNDNATNETGYQVERSANGGAWTAIANLGAIAGPNASYTDSTVTRGTDYQYRVSAVNGNDRATSNVASSYVIAAPTGLTATQVAGPAAALSWSGRAPSFLVERSTDGGTTWTSVITLGPGNGLITYTDPGATPGRTYTYRVTAVNGPDQVSSGNVSVPIVAPPTNLAFTLLNNPVRVRLTWTDAATNETGYVVERSTGGGAFTQVGTVGVRNGGTVTFTGPATRGVTYTYRVAAVSGASRGYSANLSVLVGTPPLVAGVTGSATVRTATTENLTVRWSDAPNEAQYTMAWSYNGGRTTAGTATVGTNVVTYTRSVTRTVVSVRVRANNGLGNGPWSAWVPVPRP